MKRSRGGFALMAAMWLVVLVGVTGLALSTRARSRRLGIVNAIEQVQTNAAADAALETGRAQLEQLVAHPLSGPDAALDPWGDLSIFHGDTIRLGNERATVVAYDAGSRLNVNRASEGELQHLLAALNTDAEMAAQLAARIMDWRDADSFRRSRGMERDDYLRLGARSLPTNADFAHPEELREIAGMSDSIYTRLAPNVTVLGDGRVNVNSASREVLAALPGLGEEAISAILGARQGHRPIRSVEELTNRLSAGARQGIVDANAELSQRIAFETREVVLEGTGWLASGAMRTRRSLVLQRSGDAVLVGAGDSRE